MRKKSDKYLKFYFMKQAHLKKKKNAISASETCTLHDTTIFIKHKLINSYIYITYYMRSIMVSHILKKKIDCYILLM